MEYYLGTEELRGALLHEAFHSVSVGVTSRMFRENAGFEEGVVEQAVRTLAGRVLGEAAAASVVLLRGPEFPLYVRALERIRQQTMLDAEEFYTRLLATPLEARKNVVVEWIQQARPDLSSVRAMALILKDWRQLVR